MRRLATMVLATAAALSISAMGTASATPAGSPHSPDACTGFVTAYGDHPEEAPAMFAIADGVSVQTLMDWVRDFCGVP